MDGMFTALLSPVLRKIYPCKLDEIRHNTQKEKRIINSLEGIMNQHKFIVDRKVLLEDRESISKYNVENQLQYSFIYQMTRLTKERGCLAHDDRIDVLAMGVDDCLKFLSINADDKIKQRQDRELDLLMKDFFGQFGLSFKPKNKKLGLM